MSDLMISENSAIGALCASHPLVFGDSLLSYLNNLVTVFSTHTHAGETCMGIPVTPMIPVQPFPPATSDLLSVKVKTGSTTSIEGMSAASVSASPPVATTRAGS